MSISKVSKKLIEASNSVLSGKSLKEAVLSKELKDFLKDYDEERGTKAHYWLPKQGEKKVLELKNAVEKGYYINHFAMDTSDKELIQKIIKKEEGQGWTFIASGLESENPLGSETEFIFFSKKKLKIKVEDEKEGVGYPSLDKKNVYKSDYSNEDYFEAFVIDELVNRKDSDGVLISKDSALDSKDLKTLFGLFKKDYTIAVHFEDEGKKVENQLKKDGFTKANTRLYNDEQGNLITFWVKAPSKV